MDEQLTLQLMVFNLFRDKNNIYYVKLVNIEVNICKGIRLWPC